MNVKKGCSGQNGQYYKYYFIADAKDKFVLKKGMHKIRNEINSMSVGSILMSDIQVAVSSKNVAAWNPFTIRD